MADPESTFHASAGTGKAPLEHFFGRWLQLQGKFLEAASHATLRFQAPGAEDASYYYWSKEEGGGRLNCTEQLNLAEKEQKGVVSRLADTSAGKKTVLISYPILLADRSKLSATFALEEVDERRLQEAMAHLRFGMQWLGEHLPDNPWQSTTSHSNLTDSLGTGDSGLPCAQRAKEIAALLATEFSCEEVTFCLYIDNRPIILANSKQTKPFHSSSRLDAVIAAFEECLDQRAVIVHPGQNTTDLLVRRAHEKAAEVLPAKNLLSIPFSLQRETPMGAALFERAGEIPLSAVQSQELHQYVQTAGPQLYYQQLSERSLVLLIRDRCKEFFVKTMLTGSPARKISSLLLLLCCLGLLFLRGDFIISAEGTVKGKIQRAIIAPFSGYISEAHQGAGDRVQKGDLLASMDTDELTLEQLKWASLKVEKELEYRRAIASNLTAAAKILQEQKKQAQIQLELLDMKKRQTKITAPFDGLIIKGDLTQTIGSPVERGQLLFEIVPNESFRIHLDVDEKDIDYVAAGNGGRLVVNALPNKTFDFTIDKITPSSSPKHGNNTFRVEGYLDSDQQQLSPGMKGYGKIVVSKKPLLWIWSRPLRNRLRLLIWSMTP